MTSGASRRATVGTGYTGKDYRRGLPKGVQRKEGDIYITKGHAYRLVTGIDGKSALRDLLTGFEGEGSFGHTLGMIHVAPGEQITIGEVAWEVIRLDEDVVTVSAKTAQATQVREVHALDLAAEIQTAMDAVARAASYRAGLRDTVLRHLRAAKVDYASLMYDTDKARDGIIVNGIGKDEPLPEALLLLAELPGAVVVTLKSEVDKAQPTEGKESEVKDDAQADMGELPPILVALADALGVPESTTEIKTLVQPLTDGENTFTIPAGWKIEDVTIMKTEMVSERPQLCRFVTISRLSEE